MPPWTSARLPLPLPVPVLLLLLLFSGGVRCAVEVHTAAGQHRDGLLALSPLQTIAAGPTMARRAHCLARCSRLAECVSFNYGLLPSGVTGCQLLSATLCQSGGGFSELQRDAGVRYFDVYRAATGSSEVTQTALWTECQTTGRCAVPTCQPVLGDYCTSAAVCAESVPSSSCTASTCQCLTTHWANSPTECLPGVAIGAACTVLIECQTITTGSECASGLCACPTGTWASPDNACLPVKALGGTCSVDAECGGDPTSTFCSSGICACRATFVNVNGICEPGKTLGQACTITAECTMTTVNTACLSGVCSCASGFWNNAGTCRQAVPFGGACTYAQDCTTTNPNFLCTGGTCGDFACAHSVVGGYEYRLAGGDSSCLNGRVELRPQGSTTWGQVCDDAWDAADAQVFCRSIGRSGGAASCCSPNWWGGAPTFYMDDVMCSGTESHLLACSYLGWGSHNCGSSEVSSVTCT